MPRGRLPTGTVSISSSASPSMMLIELPFSFETKISSASAWLTTPPAPASASAMQVHFLTTSILPAHSVEPALALGLVVAQRVQRRALMQKLLLRRDRDQDARTHQQDGLPQLLVPLPEAEPLALERRDLELVAHHVVVQRLRLRVVRPGYGLADDPHGDPVIIVALGHRAAAEL